VHADESERLGGQAITSLDLSRLRDTLGGWRGSSQFFTLMVRSRVPEQAERRRGR